MCNCLVRHCALTRDTPGTESNKVVGVHAIDQDVQASGSTVLAAHGTNIDNYASIITNGVKLPKVPHVQN